MDIVVGSKIEYLFPLPVSNNNISYIGTIEYIGESYIDIRNEQNIIIRISYKNYDRIVIYNEVSKNKVAEVI